MRENENKEKEFLQKSIKDSEEDGVKCCMMKVMNLINIMEVVKKKKTKQKNNHTGMECDVCGRHVVYSSDK